DTDLDAGRNSLRVALASLRRQLEPPGVLRGSILISDRDNLRLNPLAVSTDVEEFHALLATSTQSGSAAGSLAALMAAADLYRGEPLPGEYDDWVLFERERLAQQYQDALHRLVHLLEQADDLDRALHYALRAVAADPLREELHYDVMRLYALAG